MSQCLDGYNYYPKAVWPKGKVTMLKRFSLAISSLAVVVSGLVVVAPTAPASATSSVWGSAQAIPGLNALLSPSSDGQVAKKIACSSPGNCTVVGLNYSYQVTKVFVAKQVDGHWGSAQLLTLDPSIAPGTLNMFDWMGIRTLSCPTQDSCTFIATSWPRNAPSWSPSNNLGVVEAHQVNGTWSTVNFLPNTFEANHIEWPAGLNGVLSDANALSCSSPGNCVATGTMFINRRGDYGLAGGWYSEMVNGTWHDAVRVDNPSGQAAEFQAVSCPSDGNCTLLGRSGVIDEVDGTWGSLQMLPTDANFPDATYANFTQLQCASAGNCVVLGEVSDNSGGQTVSVRQVNGTWQQAVALPSFNAGSVDPATKPFPTYLFCQGAGSCVTIGTAYSTTTSSYGLYTLTMDNGTWGVPTDPVMVAPANGSTQDYSFPAASCSAVDACTVVGTSNLNGKSSPFATSLVAGSWSAGLPLARPRSVASQYDSTVGVSCGASAQCGGFVAETDSRGNHNSYVLDFPASPYAPVDPTLSVSLQAGAAYGSANTITVNATPTDMVKPVTVTVWGRKIGTCTLAAGSCSITSTKLPGGDFTLEATVTPTDQPDLVATAEVTVVGAASSIDTTGSDTALVHHPISGKRKAKALGKVSSGVKACMNRRYVDVTFTDSNGTDLVTRWLRTNSNGKFRTRSKPLTPGTYHVTVLAEDTGNCAAKTITYDVTVS